MIYYKFYDCDFYTQKEYDIAQDYYVELIEKCCSFSEYISFLVLQHDTWFINELNKYSINSQELQKIDKTELYYWENCKDGLPYRKYYKVCEEVKQILLKMTDSLFDLMYWGNLKNPTDPVFYRKDGSILFYSIIHEGECYLYPREGEDIKSILSKGNWIKYEE